MLKRTKSIWANVSRKTAGNIRAIRYNTGMSTGEIIDHLMLHKVSDDLATAVVAVLKDILIDTSNLSYADRDRVYFEILLAALMSAQTFRGLLDQMIKAGLQPPERNFPQLTSEERHKAFKQLRKTFGLISIPDVKKG